jgi:hypothetical protein
MSTENKSKKAKIYVCELCDYTSCKISNYNSHLTTTKHQKNTIGNTLETFCPQEKKYVCKCGKEYLDRTGLWKHKKKCTTNNSATEETGGSEESDDNLEDNLASNVINSIGKDQKIDVIMLLELLKQSQDFQKQMLDQQKQMMEFAANNNTTNNNINYNSNNSNNTNNSFNLNVFLNDTCKGAMNMSDFVDSIKVQLTDLENFAEVGYANGVSNIFVKGLNALGVHLRPIHCSDLKRETLYIKDNDCWVKEQEDCDKLKTAIKKVAFKNIRQINEWIKENPGCTDPRTKKHDKYNKIVMNSMSGTTIQEQQENIDKIVKNVTKAVTIDKASFKTLKH